ncbi:MAG: SDR family NAD(P)-dependent oxidoreductase [Betaproteobacteria bacterium]|nr:SDR family NAD(P)-dependent oxidoreductase [Betaproteobacteria bacterium]
MKHLTILTGASRGMGLALAQQLCLRPQAVLLCISRQSSSPLESWASSKGANLTQWRADLARPIPVAHQLVAWLHEQDLAQLASATLINNAGVIGHLGPITPQNEQDLHATLAINLEAPMLLTAAFLSITRAWDLPKKIVNISSGLGRRAMAGSSMYCASKAGLDHYSRCVALEEADRPHGARIVSLAPGVIDTDMQSDLRAGDKDLFPDRDNFVHLKQTGALSTPEQAAARVLAYLDRADFGNQVVADARDA